MFSREEIKTQEHELFSETRPSRGGKLRLYFARGVKYDESVKNNKEVDFSQL